MPDALIAGSVPPTGSAVSPATRRGKRKEGKGGVPQTQHGQTVCSAGQTTAYNGEQRGRSLFGSTGGRGGGAGGRGARGKGSKGPSTSG